MGTGGRKTDDWMQHVDERILEYLQSEGLCWPSLLAGEPRVEASRRRLRERMVVLCHVGFAAPMVGDEPSDIDHGIVITTLGQEYLRGELDARHHRPPPKARQDVGGKPAEIMYL
jgi:hypothetical protein